MKAGQWITVSSLAVFLCAGCNRSDVGTTEDFSQIKFADVKAEADTGNAAAQYELGVRYQTGNGVLKSPIEAVEWWQKSAAQKFPPAEYDLGMATGRGDGVPKNQQQGFKLVQAAADAGYARAQQAMGFFCFKGSTNIGVTQDRRRAVQWFQAAAGQNLPTSEYFLALCYQNGKGTETNPEAALQWFQRAASNGLADAQIKLGNYYCDKGMAFTKIHPNLPASCLWTNSDFMLGFEWYQKAAIRNCNEAQLRLSAAYAFGCGVEPDQVESYKWLTLASIGSYSNSAVELGEEWKVHGRKVFNPEQIAQGKQLAEEFSKTNQTKTKLLPNLPGL
jgi:hypothetical protein